jgi:hypothetical protein
MRVVIECLVVMMLSAAVATRPLGHEGSSSFNENDNTGLFPGQADFEREIKSESKRYDRARLRYEEATERARLNYIKVLEDNLDDLDDEVNRVAEYQKELERVRCLKFNSPKFEFKTYRWDYNEPPVKMIHKDEGFCFLSSLGGAFDGGAEVGRVYIGDDGYWYLHGTSGRDFLVLGATAMKIAR